MDSCVKDLRYAARALARSPSFTAVAVVTLALGIGANTAMFSVVRAVLLEPLPYEEPDELVLLWGEMRNRGVTHFPSSPPDFRDYREGAGLLEDLAAVWTFPISITGDGDPMQVAAAGVTHSFFSLLGAEPLLGRSFTEEDVVPDPSGLAPGAPGALPGMAILGHALWQQRYGGDRSVVGRTIELSGAPSEVVGVMPPGFELLLPPTAGLDPDPQIWLAARLDIDSAPRNNVFLRPIGRLRDGVTPDQLQAEIDAISVRLTSDDQVKAAAGYAMRVEPLRADLTAHVRPVLTAFYGAVVFVLLIACANASNLLLVRASGRSRELAVRAALGGRRERLARQMLVESGLLALLGGGLGVVLAAAGIELLLALSPDSLPRITTAEIDGVVLGFTFGVAVATTLLFGALPAVQGSRFDLADALRDRSQGRAAGRQGLVRNLVVVGEAALSLVLLVATGLMLRSFVDLTRVDPGFEAEGVLTFGAAIPFGRYPEASQRADFTRALQAGLEGLPGVLAVSQVVALPLSGTPFNGRYGPEEALTDPEAFRQATYRAVLPGYFEAMGTRLLAGRAFSDADQADSASVVLIDEKLAERLWPNASPIGERFLVRATTPDPVPVEVIGVVEHQRSESLATEGMETVYFTERYMGSVGGTWVVKASGDPLGLLPRVREEMRALDPDVPVADVRLMREYVDEAMSQTRFTLVVITVFALTALLLAAVGLYGVLAVTVRQRRAEIGVRMAFGARRGSIAKLVLGHGLSLTAAGIALGLPVALATTGVLESMLVGVTPSDPLTIGTVSALFLGVATLACWLPVRRATAVDPVTALREE
jgi:putative ABC transport system permease protein